MRQYYFLMGHFQSTAAGRYFSRLLGKPRVMVAGMTTSRKFSPNDCWATPVSLAQCRVSAYGYATASLLTVALQRTAGCSSEP